MPVVLLVCDPVSLREKIRVRLRDLGYYTQIVGVEDFCKISGGLPEGVLLVAPEGQEKEVSSRLRELMVHAKESKVVIYAEDVARLGTDLRKDTVAIVERKDPERDLGMLIAWLYQALPSSRRKALSIS